MPKFQMQSVEEANLELIKALLAAFAKGSLTAVGEVLTQDVKFHFPGHNSFSGEYKGLEASMSLLARVFQWTGGSTRIRIHDVLANEQHGVLMYTVTARHNDSSIRYRYMDVYHFRDAQISEVWGYPADDAAGFDEFYSD